VDGITADISVALMDVYIVHPAAVTEEKDIADGRRLFDPIVEYGVEKKDAPNKDPQ
jgi:hypothetical protein